MQQKNPEHNPAEPEPNLQIYSKAGGRHVWVFLRLWLRGNDNHDRGGGGTSKLTSFTLEGKEQTNNETGKGEHRSSLVQELN